MKRGIRFARRFGWKNALLTAAAVFVLGGWLFSLQSAEARIEEGVHPILIEGFKYTGNASCSGSDCHSADEPTMQSGQKIGNESNIWSEWDPHARTYEQLKMDESKQIAEKLGIDDAATSDRCLSCHATNAPQKQRGELFALHNAVGCESCHGPAEKYLEPHAKEGWTNRKRKEIGAQGLLKEWGLVDTSNLAARAHTCVACHLQIGKDMIDAGHPKLQFEMYGYNYYRTGNPQDEFYNHWGGGKDRDPLIDARLWAAGQAAAEEAARKQVEDWKAKGWDPAMAQQWLTIYEGGLGIVKDHFGASTAQQVIDAEVTPDQCVAAMGDLVKLADKAKTERHRRVIGFGMTALGQAAFSGRGKQVPDAFWNHYRTVVSGEAGEAYTNALKQMHQIAQQ